ncbi:MAG: ATPase, T2SS/T4P/T4SS family [Clostridium sp.]|uniref:ATPase, T2SS/T4P/T4SS family n=1 Tax=Clostridium sp. TaxID=1506 RepID=UPI001F233D3C|nr:ATPase, T2SS/T4P/T4SS family [Clostridium sp.]MDU4843959.1 ATPase, T2SS/T4P/T4SS family [Leclercia adecarboxylata]MDU7089586.1 ATPase, T2SS/T4P/T4SS family [Clostridium sp.]
MLDKNMRVLDNDFFFDSKKYKFSEVLEFVQDYISSKYSILLKNDDDDSKEEQIKSYIKNFLIDNHMKVEGLSQEELINKLYSDMAGYSFLTDYLKRDDLEEININSWDDIKIHYSNGDIEPSEEVFLSPNHAIDVVRRLLRKSNMILDNSNPLVRGYLGKNIRITVIGHGVIDDDIGVVASIRFINPKKLGREDFIKNGMMSEQMIDTIEQLYNYGTSMCITGATNSGKTTFMSWLMSTISDEKRIFTIEEEVREFDLVKKDKNGKTINNVIHTVTNKSKNIDEEKLLEVSLTSNPDFICVAEMKGNEAFSAQEAARTGHTVTTTTHANSCEATYPRMVTLCKTKYDMDDKTLYNLVTEAFPIVMFVKKLGRTRRLMDLKECIIHEDGRREIKTLFKYEISTTKIGDGTSVIDGQFRKVNNISKQLQERLLGNGMPINVLEKLVM